MTGDKPITVVQLDIKTITELAESIADHHRAVNVIMAFAFSHKFDFQHNFNNGSWTVWDNRIDEKPGDKWNYRTFPDALEALFELIAKRLKEQETNAVPD